VGKLKTRIIESAHEDLPTIIRFIECKSTDRRQKEFIGRQWWAKMLDIFSIDPSNLPTLRKMLDR
jgi:hypothetical protein